LHIRTQVAIVGAGPAGLLLSQLLHLQGIESVVLERHRRSYVEQRVRAGVLEHGSEAMLREAGAGQRMDAEGMPHKGTELRFGHRRHRIDFVELTDRHITVYGQQEIVKDLIALRLAAGGDVRFEVDDVTLHGLDTDRPAVEFVQAGERHRIECDFVVGADGFHGVSRGYLPDATVYERHYPFAWLGIIAEAPPSSDELIYARHEHGFALHSMRTPQIIRMYLQVHPSEDIATWPDERIWAELQTRLATEDGFALTEGNLLDKHITPMRSFVSTPMQYGRLLLAGDSAHIVPPTGAKGLNLAVNDVRLLAAAIAAHERGDDEPLERYSENALRRVWRAQDFSNFMTQLLHRLDDGNPFQARLQLSRLEQLRRSEAAARNLAENYVGLPATADF